MTVSFPARPVTISSFYLRWLITSLSLQVSKERVHAFHVRYQIRWRFIWCHCSPRPSLKCSLFRAVADADKSSCGSPGHFTGTDYISLPSRGRSRNACSVGEVSTWTPSLLIALVRSLSTGRALSGEAVWCTPLLTITSSVLKRPESTLYMHE